MTGINEDSDRDRHFSASDQVIHHDRCTVRTRTIFVRVAVLKHHQRRWLFRIVLLGDVDRITPHRAGEDFTFENLTLSDFSLRHILNKRIGPEDIFLIFLGGHDRPKQQRDGEDENLLHG